MRLEPLTKEDVDQSISELVASYGSFETWIGYAGHHPDLTKAIFDLLKAQKQSSVLPADIVELASVTVSLCNQCQYCVYQHSSKALGIGISQDQLDGILDESAKDLFDARSWKVVQYAKAVTQDVHSLRFPVLEALKKDWSPQQLVELTWRIAFMNAFNRFNDALGIPPEKLHLEP